MTKPLIEALNRRPVPTTPVWVMRQAGRYLPEYHQIRSKLSFQEAVSSPDVAAEITLQPIHRFGMDGAVIFADIMTPLEAMGVEMTFDPGPRLRPHSLDEVASLPEFDSTRVAFVGETIRLVRSAVPDTTAVIGFSGAPITLLAYLVEGGGSKDFIRFRGELRRDPSAAEAALDRLGDSMNRYLSMQIAAGADAVQLFDSWAGVLDRDSFAGLAVPYAARTLAGLSAPTVYFAPGAGSNLDLTAKVGATAFGLDWRLPIDVAWDELGRDCAVQGNLDPAVLLTDPATIKQSVGDILRRVGDRTGHVFNLGHGIDRNTPVDHVHAMLEAVRA